MRPSRRALFTGLPATAGTADEGRVSWGRYVVDDIARCLDASRC